MDAALLSPDADAELALLRRRAYGPDADIAADPRAMARLRELEQLRSTPQTPLPAASDAREAAGASALADAATIPEAEGSAERLGESVAPRAEVPRATGLSPSGQAPAGSATPRIRWWRRHARLAVAAALALTALVAVSVTRAVSAGPSPDATLHATGEQPSAALSDSLSWLVNRFGLDLQSVQGHDPFGQISVWTADASSGRQCLFLTSVNSGVISMSCMPAGFDPTIDVSTYADMYPSVDAALPDDTSLRFVMRGDGVEVWVREPPASTNDAEGSR